MTLTDLGWAARTRVCCVYDLTPRLRPRSTRSLADAFDFGRFQGHVDGAARLLPTVAYSASYDGARLGLTLDGSRPEFTGDLTVVVLVSPRHDAVLLLDVTMPESTDVGDVVTFLAATCFERHTITLDGQPLLRWLSQQLGLAAPLRFGRNVHQCVFPGQRMRGRILGTGTGALTPAVTDIVRRGTVVPDRGGRLGIRVPEALVSFGEAMVAHGRGVSLIAGWGPPVQNILTLTAATLVSALGVLHRARDLAFDALTRNQESLPHSTDDARALVASLSTSLNELQLDLSFGVEACMDGVVVPEMVVDNYRESLQQATGLADALANTSRMVERLAAVIDARAAVLDAAVQDEQDRRGRVFNVVLAVGSLIALPPSLLLAFFGVSSPDVDPDHSITDLGRYWPAYALAWLPFAALLLVGFVLRRRIRSSPRLFGDAAGSPPATEGLVGPTGPTARPPSQPGESAEGAGPTEPAAAREAGDS